MSSAALLVHKRPPAPQRTQRQSERSGVAPKPTRDCRCFPATRLWPRPNSSVIFLPSSYLAWHCATSPSPHHCTLIAEIPNETQDFDASRFSASGHPRLRRTIVDDDGRDAHRHRPPALLLLAHNVRNVSKSLETGVTRGSASESPCQASSTVNFLKTGQTGRPTAMLALASATQPALSLGTRRPKCRDTICRCGGVPV
jgi:hypothetical protein